MLQLWPCAGTSHSFTGYMHEVATACNAVLTVQFSNACACGASLHGVSRSSCPPPDRPPKQPWLPVSGTAWLCMWSLFARCPNRTTLRCSSFSLQQQLCGVVLEKSCPCFVI